MQQTTTRYAGGEQRLYQKSHQSGTIKLFKLIVKKERWDFMANKSNGMSYMKWMCKYHIVFIPKYRRKAIYVQYRADLREIIKTLWRYKGVEILEGHMKPDHAHLLLSIPPKMSVSCFMGYLKGKSALMMFDKHANLNISMESIFLGRRILCKYSRTQRSNNTKIYRRREARYSIR